MDLNSNICIICQKSNNLPELYGDFMTKGKISAHYFCLLLSSNLLQRGKDDAGILGFQLNDIKAYVKTIRNNKCMYCNEKSASIKCEICKQDFHIICGVKEKCQFQFTGQFKSFCHLHIQIKHKSKHPDNQLCVICYQAMRRYHPVLSVAPKCCEGNWFHRICLMKYSLSAGYYVKCFWCQSKDFRDQIRLEGIFVPDRDASWEKQPNAYLDLHQPSRKCSATYCLCPKGIIFFAKVGIWSMILCSMCGAYGLHLGCLQSTSNNTTSDDLICEDCVLIRTVRSTATFSHTDYRHISSNSKCEEKIDKLSYLDKTLYLTKTNMESGEDGLIDHHNVEIDKNANIIQYEDYNKIELSDDLIKLQFKKGDLNVRVTGYLEDSNEIKAENILDEIIPIMLQFNKADSSSSSSSSSSYQSESDLEDNELFLSILSQELKKVGKTINEIQKPQTNKSFVSKRKKRTQTFFCETKHNKNLKAIVKARATNIIDFNEDMIDFDKIEIKKLLIYESKYNSEIDPSESDVELFDNIVEHELMREKRKNSKSKK